MGTFKWPSAVTHFVHPLFTAETLFCFPGVFLFGIQGIVQNSPAVTVDPHFF
jgi:hypothetical protein